MPFLVPMLGAIGGLFGGGAAAGGMALAGAGASIAGNVMGSRAAGSSRTIPAARPQALFPWLQDEYTGLVGGPEGLGATSAGTLQEMIKTGMPTDVGPAFEALLKSKQRFVGQGRENIAEMFGASGQRFGTPLMSSLVDYESQVSSDFMSILSEYTRQAQESARQRQLAASQYGFEAFGAPALAFSPSEHLLTGGTSPTGTGLQGIGSFLTLLMSLFKKP